MEGWYDLSQPDVWILMILTDYCVARTRIRDSAGHQRVYANPESGAVSRGICGVGGGKVGEEELLSIAGRWHRKESKLHFTE